MGIERPSINGAGCPVKPSHYFIQIKMDLNTYAQKDVLDDLLDELLDVNNRIMARNTKEPVDWSYDVGTPANGTKFEIATQAQASARRTRINVPRARKAQTQG